MALNEVTIPTMKNHVKTVSVRHATTPDLQNAQQTDSAPLSIQNSSTYLVT